MSLKVGREGVCGGYLYTKTGSSHGWSQVRIADWYPRHRAVGHTGSESKELGMGEGRSVWPERTGERR